MIANRTIEEGYHGELAADLWNQFDHVGVDTTAAGPVGVDGSVDGLVGTYIRNKPVLSYDDVAHFLNRGDLATQYTALDPFDPLKNYDPRTGASWAGHKGDVNGIFDAIPFGYTDGAALNTLNYGFYNTRDDIDPGYKLLGARLNGFSAFSDAQRVAARQAIETWDELIAVEFIETEAAKADINFMNTTTGPIQASAYLPYNYGAAYGTVAGDVAVNPTQISNQQFDEGEYGLTTLIHELGHSLGLEHPGRYNFSANFTATYINGAEYYQDSNQYSIMSYWRAQETGANHVDWTTTVLKYGSTPGVHDVAAIQRIYGADMSTRIGDDVYGFNTNTGLDTFNFAETPHPIVTIWDAGGNDTLDLSGYNTPSTIDLNPGSFSSAGGTFLATIPTLAEVNAARLAAGLAARSQASYDSFVATYGVAFKNGLLTDNISIAYGAMIENAVGGGGDDKILGNTVINTLSGGLGNDRLTGGDGVDRLIGGDGADVFVGEINQSLTASKQGLMSIETILDFGNGDDLIDLSGLDANTGVMGDQNFTWDARGSGNKAGQVYFKTFGNVNAAENSLGIDLDDTGTQGGPVTILFGNTDGDKSAEFAIVLFDVKGIDPSDVMFG
jgi:serralysin